MVVKAESFTRTDDGCTFQYHDGRSAHPQIHGEMRVDFNAHGFVIVRNLFDRGEVAKLRQTLDADEQFNRATFEVSDLKQTNYRQTQWIEPGTDIIGRLSGNAKVAGLAKQLLNSGDLYMSNGKFVKKTPNSGGEVRWHQDFGDWFVSFDFITCIVALTRSDRTNGGIQVIEQGHKYGRPAHVDQGAQSVLDPQAIQHMLNEHALLNVDLGAGDAVFFHGNMPHMSRGNTSSQTRINIIFNFNALTNVVDAAAAKHINLRGQYPVFNALNGEFAQPVYDAYAVQQCADTRMHERTFLDVNAKHNA